MLESGLTCSLGLADGEAVRSPEVLPEDLWGLTLDRLEEMVLALLSDAREGVPE